MTEAAEGAGGFLKMFDDPDHVAQYTEGPRRFVPGFDALHRMTGLLLAERAPADARILVLGAGGGLELAALAEAYPGWHFVGVDPAAEMIELARRTVGIAIDRVDLVTGYIDDAPEGPFDGAVCLLTLHFLEADERRRTIAEIHRRLRPGAAFVAAHGSFPQAAGERERWLDRYAAFAIASGADPEKIAQARAVVSASVPMLDPEEDLALLRAGGFADATPFWMAFTWRGWVGHA